MDHTFCMTIITALGGAVLGLAGTTWKILLWFKKESEERLKDSQALSKIVGGDDETKVK